MGRGDNRALTFPAKLTMASDHDDLRRAALEYHEKPPSGKDFDRADQATGQPARPRPRVLARRGRRERSHSRGSFDRLPLHGARQPGGCRDERHRGARPRRDRSARGQAGDGRQGGPVQEVRGHRRLRHRDQPERPRQADRDHRGARADLRRHQPRGHQGARVLLRRAQAARAHEDPGLPRRPARHGDHRRRGDPQWAEGRRQRPEAGQARHERRGRGRAGLPEVAGRTRPAARKHLGHRHRRRRLPGPHGADGRGQGALRAADLRAHAGRSDPRTPTSSWVCRPAAC